MFLQSECPSIIIKTHVSKNTIQYDLFNQLVKEKKAKKPSISIFRIDLSNHHNHLMSGLSVRNVPNDIRRCLRRECCRKLYDFLIRC